MCTRIETRGRHLGFTLVEMIVVLVIVAIVSVAVLGSGIVGSIQHRQVSETGRLLQGAIVGARDQAIHTGQPCGIRLLSDPAFPLKWIVNSAGQPQIDSSQILAYNRVIPIESAPEYTEGAVSIYPSASYPAAVTAGRPCLVLEAAIFDVNGLPNSPTSWAWNVRVGDKIQINSVGMWYTVIGPMGVMPNQGNTELFVNYGNPPIYPIQRDGSSVEYLLLTNGRDDNANGWTDEGWDGVDNNGINGPDDLMEWEAEQWIGGSSAGTVSVSYTIRRRPVPAANSREIALPTSMVIDATSALSTQERSRLPVNPLDGTVDILLNPDGTVVSTTIYSTPASVGMTGAFYHFWLAERQDLAATTGTSLPSLPIARPGGSDASVYSGPTLKGEYSLLTLFTHSGNIVINANPPFDDPIAAAAAGRPYLSGLPYQAAQQGVRGQ